MTIDHRVGDLIEYDGQIHAITAFDFIARKVTLRSVDESKPLGQRFGPAVVIPLSKLPLQ